MEVVHSTASSICSWFRIMCIYLSSHSLAVTAFCSLSQLGHLYFNQVSESKRPLACLFSFFRAAMKDKNKAFQ